MTVELEQQIAKILADDRAVNQWLKFFFHGRAFDVADREEQLARWTRGYVLRCCAAAMHYGFDGAEVSKPSRNADEHRVGDVAAGSKVLHLLATDGIPLCAIDWTRIQLHVARALTPPCTPQSVAGLTTKRVA